MKKHVQKITFIFCLLLAATLIPSLQATEAPQAWFDAAEAGKKKRLAKLYDDIHNIDIEAKGQYEMTALHLSARNGHLAVVKYLVEQGAELETQGGWGKMTALHFSAEEGHLAVVKYLVEQGADIEAQDCCKRTALHWSACEGHLACVKYLVEKGADIHTKYNDGGTALHLSAQENNFLCVKYLVEQGADIQATTNYGRTTLNVAHEFKNKYIVQFLEGKLKAHKSASPQKAQELHTTISRLEAIIAKFNVEAKERAANATLALQEQAMASKEAEMNMKLKLMEKEMAFKELELKLKEQAMAFRQREKDLIDNFEKREQELQATIKRLTKNEGVLHLANDTPYL